MSCAKKCEEAVRSVKVWREDEIVDWVTEIGGREEK